jgi:hypothetical protein
MSYTEAIPNQNSNDLQHNIETLYQSKQAHMPESQLKNLVRMETLKLLIYGNKVCEKCGEPAKEIHHLVYRWKPQPEDIIFLCVSCHRKLNKDKKNIILDDVIDKSLENKYKLNKKIRPPTPIERLLKKLEQYDNNRKHKRVITITMDEHVYQKIKGKGLSKRIQEYTERCIKTY